MPEPSAVLVVADTLRTHRLVQYRDLHAPHCACGWTSPERDCTWTDHPEHVAAAVVDALGGLTRDTASIPEWFNTGEMIPNPMVAGPDMVPERGLRFIPSARWVSGWVREPAEDDR